VADSRRGGLTGSLCNVHNAQMSVKTISLKLEAYNRLRAARRYPSESFSEVVLRATWPEDTVTARELLALARTGRVRFSDEELDRVEALKRRETPPEDKWASR
jgi:predicted CopG family antitoxin